MKSNIETRSELTERVAEAIWEAQKEKGLPLWRNLDAKMDRKLKNEMRAMADAAIRVVMGGGGGFESVATAGARKAFLTD